MRKFTSLFIIFLLIGQFVNAGGLLTNANQSAQYVRMLSRNASTQIDAVYFNPAGLIKMEDGWHFAVHNQSIFQDKTVDSKFPLLNNGVYEGKVKAPVFPSVFAVYKKDKLALSFGLGPNGGGGSASFDRGLPSFEIPLTKLVPGMAGLSALGYNVTGYEADLNFEGSSVFWGLQLGASYKLSEMFSVYGGLRYLPSKNTYTGYIHDIELNVGGQLQNAQTFLGQTSTALSGLAAQAGAAATQLSGTAASMQGLIDGGASSYTIAQVEGAGFIDAATRAQLEGGLAAIGMSADQIAGIDIGTAQQSFNSAAATYQGQSALLNGTSASLSQTASGLGDKEVDTEQTGAGFTPIIGFNYSPSEKFNIGVKYEFETKLALENKTKVDDLGLFPDGGKSDSDLPAILTVGVGYNPVEWLETQLSYNLYFDKGVNWGTNVRDGAIWKSVDATKVRTREIDNNYYEIGLGLQFNLSETFAISVGGLRSAAGIADSYQSDFSYSNPSVTGAFGIQWKISENLTLDAGFLNTFYEDKTHTFDDPDVGSYKETFAKTTTDFAFGISYSIF